MIEYKDIYIILFLKDYKVNLFAFAYGLFNEDFSPIYGPRPVDWREIFMKQTVDKCK